ncbi:hypothetical protein HIDPHFAB_03133 [Nocardioides sp. T2.26MG-1]|jgi:hypothetical protein|nr:hypothetical protein HIDPHFAB_03133 [Nocardioides sp. T2.26MG-1]
MAPAIPSDNRTGRPQQRPMASAVAAMGPMVVMRSRIGQDRP